MAKEVRGVDDLKQIGKLIWNGDFKPPATKRASSSKKSVAVEKDEPFPLVSRKIVIFGGKGGVGKTTAAAAFALALARSKSETEVADLLDRSRPLAVRQF